MMQFFPRSFLWSSSCAVRVFWDQAWTALGLPSGFDLATPEPFFSLNQGYISLGSLACLKINLLLRIWWCFSAIMFPSSFIGLLLRSLSMVEMMVFVVICSVEGTLISRKLHFCLRTFSQQRLLCGGLPHQPCPVTCPVLPSKDIQLSANLKKCLSFYILSWWI